VQCKGKDALYGQKVTARELKEEVAKALEFKPQLNHWLLVTTAPKDPKLEEVARLITADHQRQGLFTVKVLGWEDLKNMILDSEEVMNKHYRDQSPKQQRMLNELQSIQDGQALQNNVAANNHAASMGTLAGIGAQLASLVDSSVNDVLIGEAILQARVDDARDAIREHKPLSALRAIEKLEAAHWGNASDLAKFRALVNKSVALYSLDRVEEAARSAISALAYAPRDARAIVYAAQGHYLRGRNELSREMLDELLEREPANEDAVALRIAVAFDEPDVEDPYRFTARCNAAGWNVTLSAARWYRHRGRWSLAIVEFKRALAVQPDRLEVIAEVATAILENLFRGRSALFMHRMSTTQAEDFKLATDLLERAWATAKKSELVGAYIPTAANLATVYRFQVEWDKARLLIEEALVLQPGNLTLLQQMAMVAAAIGDHKLTIRVLDQIGSKDPEAMLMRSSALEALHLMPEALAALEAFPSDCNARLRIAAAGARIKLLVSMNMREKAFSVAVTGADEFPTSALARLLVSEYHRYTGDAEAALGELAITSSMLRDDDSDDGLERMIVAEAFAMLEAWDHAADLLAEVGGECDCEPLRLRVQTLLKAGRRTELRQLLEQLAEEVARLPFYTHSASWLYRLSGDYDKARQKLELYLSSMPHDLGTRMLWLDVVDRLGDTAAAKVFLDGALMFDRTSSSTRDLLTLAQRLVAEGQLPRGLELGYWVLRERWKSPEAHQPYIGLVLMAEKSGNGLPTTAFIGLETTFTVEDDYGKQYAYTIEPASDRKVELGEIAPNSGLAVRASGCVVGELLQVNDSELTPRQKIVAIVHKYVGLFQRSLNEFNSLFPDNQSMMSLRFDASHPERMIEQMRPLLAAKAVSLQMILNQYKQGMPVAFVASMIGRDPVDGWYIIWQNGVPVDVCSGTEPEREQALAHLRSSTGLVVDPTTAWIAGAIGVLDQLEEAFGPLGITASAIELFEERQREARERTGRPEGAMAERAGQVVFMQATEAEQQSSSDFAGKMARWSRERAIMVPAFSKVDLAPEVRKIGERTHRSVTDVIAAASGSGRLFLCEDRHLRRMGEEVAAVAGVWLQPALMLCLDRRFMTRFAYNTAVTKLALLGHSVSALDDQLLLQAADANGWEAGSTFQRLVKILASPTIEIHSLVRLSAAFIHRLWALPKSRRRKEALTSALLAACLDAHQTAPLMVARTLARSAGTAVPVSRERFKNLRNSVRFIEEWSRIKVRK
jgi:tetratricopeptide (TPR) repeat protein